jgi:succinyl-diaminopimelate desuccinylase
MSNFISLLAELVAMPTLTADAAANEQALDYIEDYLAKRGMHCQRHRFEGHGALTASTQPKNHKTPPVLLSAHADIVSGDESLFTLREADGKLYGRGVFDMKFSIAGYMQLVDDLAATGELAKYDFGIMITTDEEATPGYDRSGVAKLIREGHHAGICILPDSTAPGWEVEKVAKGWWRFELLSSGKTAHGARPWEGESASIKLIHALHELKELFKDHGPATDSLNIGAIEGGTVYNQVPDHMIAKVEIRLLDEKSYGKNKQLVDALCAKHGLTYTDFSVVQPVRPLLDNPLATAYFDSVELVTGKRPEGYISLAGSDAPYFTAAGIPCILSCPLGGRHHSEEEWVDKASLLQFMPILHDFLDRTARLAAPVDKQVQNTVQ